MFTSAHGKGSQLFSLWVAMAIAVSGSVADDVLGLIDSEESGAWRFDLIPFYYEAVGEGYCVGSEGDALNKIIQFTIPDEFKESRYEMKRFCGKWCHYEAQYSGFQIHNNTLTQELDCQCLIGNGEKVANAINDGSGEYLQCFSFISPSVIDDFQFKGYGGCMDADFQNYDRVEHVKVTSLEDCRTICLESSGSKKLAGLEYDNPTMNCYCQFADKQGPVGPVDHDYVNTACYAFSQFIPKPAISTTTPSLSHSVTTSAAVVTTISSTSMTWEDVLPSYKALGEGYCVNSAGQPSFIYSQTLIPESSSISNEYASHFCGNYCDDTQSNHSGFQIRRDHIHQNLQCHCLKNEGQESDSIDDASGEYLQCFQHIMSQTAVDRNPSTANNVDMTTTLIAILFMHYYIF